MHRPKIANRAFQHKRLDSICLHFLDANEEKKGGLTKRFV